MKARGGGGRARAGGGAAGAAAASPQGRARGAGPRGGGGAQGGPTWADIFAPPVGVDIAKPLGNPDFTTESQRWLNFDPSDIIAINGVWEQAIGRRISNTLYWIAEQRPSRSTPQHNTPSAAQHPSCSIFNTAHRAPGNVRAAASLAQYTGRRAPPEPPFSSNMADRRRANSEPLHLMHDTQGTGRHPSCLFLYHSTRSAGITLAVASLARCMRRRGPHRLYKSCTAHRAPSEPRQ